MTNLKPYLPTIMLLLSALGSAATPAVTAFWASYANAAVVIAPLAIILAHWLPSPIGPKSEPTESAGPQ